MKRSRRVAYGLVLLPLLIVGGQALVQHSLSRAQSAGAEIRLADRQVYLMGRIARHGLPTPQGAPSAARALRADVSEWASAHDALLDGDPSRGLAGVRHPAARIALDSLTPLVRAVASAVPGEGAAVSSLLLDTERAFTPAMSRAASALDGAASQHVLRLRRLVGAVGVALLGAAMLVGLFLFREGDAPKTAPPAASPKAPRPDRDAASRKVPGLLTGFRWTMSLGAVVVVGTWGVNELVGSGEYADPVLLRLLCGAALVALGAASFHRRFMLRPVALAAASGVLAYQAWLGAVNGLDSVWVVSVLTMGAALAISLGPYARGVREVWTGQACLLAAVAAPLVAVGAPADRAALVVAYYVVLLITTGFAGVVFVHTRQALRDGRESLRERSRLLRTVIDAIPEHIYVKDVEGRCLVRNRFSCDSMGMDDPSRSRRADGVRHVAPPTWQRPTGA